jgi:hypothetical protein
MSCVLGCGAEARAPTEAAVATEIKSRGECGTDD